MTNERLQEIKQRASRATPGPWNVWPGGSKPGDPYYGAIVNTEDHTEMAYIPVAGRRYQEVRASAEFIAHSRQDIQDLIAEVERLQAIEGKI